MESDGLASSCSPVSALVPCEKSNLHSSLYMTSLCLHRCNNKVNMHAET